MLKEAILGMPDIRCTRCGASILMDSFSLPYRGEVACPGCKNVMDVELLGIGTSGSKVRTKFLNPIDDIGLNAWSSLSEIEQDSILNASSGLGVEAYTISEFGSLRTLESVSRRCYEKIKGAPVAGKTWFVILDELANEPAFRPFAQGINYFRDVRNKLGHPEKISNKLDAESSYKMALRLCAELVDHFSPPV